MDSTLRYFYNSSLEQTSKSQCFLSRVLHYLFSNDLCILIHKVHIQPRLEHRTFIMNNGCIKDKLRLESIQRRFILWILGIVFNLYYKSRDIMFELKILGQMSSQSNLRTTFLKQFDFVFLSFTCKIFLYITLIMPVNWHVFCNYVQNITYLFISCHISHLHPYYKIYLSGLWNKHFTTLLNWNSMVEFMSQIKVDHDWKPGSNGRLIRPSTRLPRSPHTRPRSQDSNPKPIVLARERLTSKPLNPYPTMLMSNFTQSTNWNFLMFIGFLF